MTVDFSGELMRPTSEEIGTVQRNCNRISKKFGLSLSEEETLILTQRRFENLRETGRAEFGGGVLEKLVYAFCDSPCVTQESYQSTLEELQTIFYQLKNETPFSDDELIRRMRVAFDGRAGGTPEYLAEMVLLNWRGE